ncbi:MAG: glycoside hydrolase family 32 protein [Actinomycetota bacterium]
MEQLTEGAYHEAFRPQVHYTPKQHWMNDPNGLVYHLGEYHLFYQYNPHENKWGNMSWGHAVSSDLISWTELPVAITPDDGVEIFSGSAIIDQKNVSGLGTSDSPAMVAFYTAYHGKDRPQTQNIAYSIDRGRSWIKYLKNPVIDIGSHEFRDPKVFWYEPQQKWVMVVVVADERKAHFYESFNLLDWVFLSEFGPAGSHEGDWEVPDMFALPLDDNSHDMHWVLKVDVIRGGIAGGSGAQYFIGIFDGSRFVPTENPPPTRWVDYGKDFYAAVSWSGIKEHDGREVWVGWMNNCQYSHYLPTEPWRGQQSLPRSLHLHTLSDGIYLIQEPIKEIEKLRGKKFHQKDLFFSTGNHSLEIPNHSPLDIVATFTPVGIGRFGFRFCGSEKHEVLVGYDTVKETIFVDRRHCGVVDFHPDFPTLQEAPLPLTGGSLTIRILRDTSSVEVFADQRVVISSLFFTPDTGPVELFVEPADDPMTLTVNTMDVWELRSIWADTTARGFSSRAPSS